MTATVPSLAPTSAFNMLVGQQTANQAWSATGTPTIMLVSNIGDQTVYVALGSSTVKADPAASTAILPRTPPVSLTLGANTNIAAVCPAGASAINVTVGN